MDNTTIGEDLATIWSLLDLRISSSLRTAKLGVKLANRPFLAGVDILGARQILIPTAPNIENSGIWRNGALDLSRTNLIGEDRKTRTWLVLRCKRSELEGVFLLLCSNLLDQLNETTETAIEQKCLAILEEWRGLMGGGIKDETTNIGLMGELMFLNQMATIDAIKAWQSWHGPKGGRHDFRIGKYSVEIKSTRRSVSQSIDINGINQLEVPDKGELMLCFFRFECVPKGQLSIKLLVENLIEKGMPSAELHSILEESNIFSLFEQGSLETFELRQTLFYKIDDDFPRITAASFKLGSPPKGILTVNYTVDLSQLSPVETVDADLIIPTLLAQ